MGAKPFPVSSNPSFLTIALLLAAATARADGQPAVKQAEALIAEQEHDFAKALTLLREAHKATPDDLDIAFDRARVALEHSELSQPEDFDGYLSLEPVTPDQRLLRAYILAARGHTDEARSEAQAAAIADPENAEAKGLVEALAPAAGEATPSSIAARVRVYGKYDTNVSVLPDRTGVATGSTIITTPVGDAQRAAFGLGVEGDVRWTPVRGLTELSFLAGVSFLGHVTGRNDEDVDVVDSAGVSSTTVKPGAKLYDFGTIDLQARLAFPRERWHSAIELYGTSVFIDDFASRYLTEGTLLGSSNYAVNDSKSLRVGAYGLGGLRSFGEGFGVRDGQRAEGGITVDYLMRHAAFGVRGGYQAELTDSPLLTESGAIAMLYARGSTEHLDAMVSFTYQHRGYDSAPNQDPTLPDFERTDNRFGPSAQLAYWLNDMLSVVGTYQYLRNVSSGYPADFDYARHLVTLGLEARL